MNNERENDYLKKSNAGLGVYKKRTEKVKKKWASLNNPKKMMVFVLGVAALAGGIKLLDLIF